jgi:hypothetical protein
LVFGIPREYAFLFFHNNWDTAARDSRNHWHRNSCSSLSLPPEQRISQEFRLSIYPKNHAPECTAAIASRVIFS